MLIIFIYIKQDKGYISYISGLKLISLVYKMLYNLGPGQSTLFHHMKILAEKVTEKSRVKLQAKVIIVSYLCSYDISPAAHRAGANPA